MYVCGECAVCVDVVLFFSSSYLHAFFFLSLYRSVRLLRYVSYSIRHICIPNWISRGSLSNIHKLSPLLELSKQIWRNTQQKSNTYTAIVFHMAIGYLCWWILTADMEYRCFANKWFYYLKTTQITLTNRIQLKQSTLIYCNFAFLSRWRWICWRSDKYTEIENMKFRWLRLVNLVLALLR